MNNDKPFNKISDFQDRWYPDPGEPGPRKGSEYRGPLRNAARIAYRVAKKSFRDIQKSRSSQDGDNSPDKITGG